MGLATANFGRYFFRDNAITAFSKALKLYAASEDPEEVEASKSLRNLFNRFKNLDALNFEAETLGIDKLLDELESKKYAGSVALLNIGKYVTRMKVSNENFKILFGGRMGTESMTETFNLKAIFKEMLRFYSDFIANVLAIAKTLDAPPLFNTALTLLNTARKYYADLLARRTIKGVKEQPTV